METKARKVLIADDEPDILEILKYNLSNEGYEVFTAKLWKKPGEPNLISSYWM